MMHQKQDSSTRMWAALHEFKGAALAVPFDKLSLAPLGICECGQRVLDLRGHGLEAFRGRLVREILEAAGRLVTDD